MTDGPEDLLTARLIRQENEIAELRAANDIYSAALKFCDGFIAQIIDSMIEPIILRDIAEKIDDELYRELLFEYSKMVDLYKTTLDRTQREFR
jgi:Xaa-Pro aminopeptidase